jgi:tRNA1Val (adenine37-N6)-methyltransferase
MSTKKPPHDRADDPADWTTEHLGPFHFIQKKVGHRVTGDSLLLADFALPLKEDESVIDLGTGTGVITLVLAWKSPVQRIVGVDLERGSADVARRNVETNGLNSRVTIIEKDWRELPDLYPKGAFPVVVSNPPYVKKGAGRESPVKQRAIARSEVMGTLEELLKVSAYLAGPAGRICFIYPVTRFLDVRDGLNKAGLRPRRVRFVPTKSGSVAKLFLMETARGGGLNQP